MLQKEATVISLETAHPGYDQIQVNFDQSSFNMAGVGIPKINAIIGKFYQLSKLQTIGIKANGEGGDKKISQPSNNTLGIQDFWRQIISGHHIGRESGSWPQAQRQATSLHRQCIKHNWTS